jgi:ABC-type lipoprotein release transport system permease subunit
VFFAVFFSSVMYSYMEGMWGQMIANTLKVQSGHIEIHEKGYWDDKALDNFMAMDSATIEALRAVDNVENVSPRMETFALASLGAATKGAAIMGVSPLQEDRKSKLAAHLIDGAYLSETDDGVLLAEGLAEYLQAATGDTIALIGQGHFGASAAGLFPVRGILRFSITEMNNNFCYMPLAAAQSFINMTNGYSGVLISLKEDKNIGQTMQETAQIISGTPEDNPHTLHTNGDVLSAGNYEVMSWHFTMRRLLQTAASDKAFSKVVLWILYLIVGFGMLGTVIMLTNERKREFRTMISIGMQRGKLAAVVSLELVLTSSLGIALGVALAYPVAFYFHANPIRITGEMAAMFNDMGMEPVIPFSVEPVIFVKQIIIILALSALTMIYPARKIRKLKCGA